MDYFDFHTHNKNEKNGVYNLDLEENPNENLFSVGLHPKDLNKNWKNNLEHVKKHSIEKNCFAIGECGLDSLIQIDGSLQKEVFMEQIFWANEINKPVIVHCVRRFAELIQIKKKAKTPLIVHGYHKNETLAKELLAHDFYISFGKAVFRNVSLQKIIEKIPKNRFFLETDAADFPIKPLYEKVAEIRKTTVEEINFQINSNLNELKNR